MKTLFHYKLNKSINLWIVEDFDLSNTDEIVKVFDFELKKEKNYHQEDLKPLKQVLEKLNQQFSIIFLFEKYHNFSFLSKFYYIERKKILQGQKKVSEKMINDKIWRKYQEIYDNFTKNIELFDHLLESSEQNLTRITKILKTIKYIKYDLTNLLNFIENYQYHWDNETKNNSLDLLFGELNNLHNFVEVILVYYAKKSGKWEQKFKVALNPAILNTNPEINKNFQSADIQNLTQEVEKLGKQNELNKQTKTNFLELVNCYLNHILFNQNFFQASNNHNYKAECKKIYEEFNNSNYSYWQKEKEFMQDFLKKVGSDLNITIDDKDKSFVQLNKELYQLTRKKRELKEAEKNCAEISKQITEIKRKIQIKLKSWLYWQFVSIQWEKAKIAQIFSQKNQELMNKLNFDKELEAYSHFGYLIKWNNRIFLYLLEKQPSFNINLAEEHLKQFLTNTSNYQAHIFQSLTLKWLTKLAFIKQAFWTVPNNIMSIYKQKSYNKRERNNNRQANLHTYIWFLLTCLNSEKWKELFDYVQIDKLKKANQYTSLIDFEKDLLRNSYAVKTYNVDIEKLKQEKLFFELDIVNRKFVQGEWVEYNKQFENETPQLKRQNDIQIFYNFFDVLMSGTKEFIDNNYENIRLVPDVKLFLNTKLEWDTKKEKIKLKADNYDVYHKNRLFRNKLTVSFLFEYNPLEIGKNAEVEKQNWLKTIVENSKQDDFTVFWIDIWETEFATLWIYDKNLIPKTITVNWKEESILNLTDLKVNKWEIVKLNSNNSEKYHFLADFYKYLFHCQSNLKDILTKIWEITVSKQEYQNIKNKISQAVDLFIQDFQAWNNREFLKRFFPIYENENQQFQWLKQFLFDFIKIKEWQTINLSDHYKEIFKKFEWLKSINFKEAFGSNFIGIIRYLLDRFPNSILVFENSRSSYQWWDSTLQNILSKSYGAYVWNYIFQSLFNWFKWLIKWLSKTENNWQIKQFTYFDKNLTKSLESQHGNYWYNGIIFRVDNYNTSKACPKCNESLIFVENWKVMENKKVKCLFGHGETEFETKMHHINDPQDTHYEKWKYFSENCVYNLENDDRFTTWDDIATYNIAKKWLEYLQNINSLQVPTSNPTGKSYNKKQKIPWEYSQEMKMTSNITFTSAKK